MKVFYRRNLPHILPLGAIIFITFRLAGSLPKHKAEQLQEQLLADVEQANQQYTDSAERATMQRRLKKAYFNKFDELLDRGATGPLWLREPDAAAIVVHQIERLASLGVRVLGYCIMPNHVHLVVELPCESDFSFQKMMQQLKGSSAYLCNKLLRQTGPFWQHESYDHVVRNQRELERVLAYVIENPVKAGLVEEWQQWQFSYKIE